MQLMVVGVSHRSAPIELRERLALDGERLDAALQRLRSRVAEGLILSTCNRTEVYACVGHAGSGAQVLSSFLAECGSLTLEDLAPGLYVHAHAAAARQLFAVASGMESMVTGEDQILAQLKHAIARAESAGTMGPVMHRLVTTARATGKRVRSETGINHRAVSVVSVALHAAADELGGLAGRRAVVVGAGHTAELALKHLAGAQLSRVTVVNRTRARAESLAPRYGALAAPGERLGEEIGAADLVIACTTSPTPVIGRALVERVLEQRSGRPLVLLDLALPRDVEPSAAACFGVSVWDIDRLQGVAERNRELRQLEIAAAEEIVAESVGRFTAWWSARAVAPTIGALVGRAAAIRDAEVDRALRKIPGLSEREEEIIRTMAARVVNKLLHEPLTRLKESAERGNMAQVLRQLFALSLAEAATTIEAAAPLFPSGRRDAVAAK